MSSIAHCCHNLGSPSLLAIIMGIVFILGTAYYVLRLFLPKFAKEAVGYWDWENEIGHGICMLSMAACLLPAIVSIPTAFWSIALPIGSAWFILRACFWGKSLSHNKLWYDWVHAGMLFGMYLMFYPVNDLWINFFQGCFWLWFSAYYIKELKVDFIGLRRDQSISRSKKMRKGALYLGSDLAHLVMGISMFLMLTCPSVFSSQPSSAASSAKVSQMDSCCPNKMDSCCHKK